MSNYLYFKGTHYEIKIPVPIILAQHIIHTYVHSNKINQSNTRMETFYLSTELASFDTTSVDERYINTESKMLIAYFYKRRKSE